MIADLKPYPEYRDSGSEWLGVLPSHWETAFVAHVGRPKSVVNQPDRQLLSVYLHRGVVRFADVEEKRTNQTSDDLTGYQVVDPGDLVLNNQQAWRGSVGVSVHAGIVSPAYLVLALAPRYHHAYADMFFRNGCMVSQYYVCSKGVGTIQRNLYWPHLKSARAILPPPDEQIAIVRFVNWANGRLDRAIRAKRKVIALLNEQKQVIIHRAVTRGLDLSLPTSTQPGSFVRDVPTHWTLMRAKFLFRQMALPVPENAEVVTCFRDGQVTLRSNRRTTGFTNAIWELGYQGIAPGQLVLHSMDAFAGAIGISDSTGKCSPEYVICEPTTDGVLLDYYAYLLRSLALRGLFITLCSSVRERAPRVRFNDFGSFVLPKPPLNEQKDIVRHIRHSCQAIDDSLRTIQREADLLREYRTRLVADLVTGKLDVRQAAAQLPDEALPEPDEASELTDETEVPEEDAA